MSELNFLQKAQMLETYGVDPHPCKVDKNKKKQMCYVIINVKPNMSHFVKVNEKT